MKELETEFSENFVQLMKNRMIVSYHKYGALADAYPHRVNAIESLNKRLEKYEGDGNTEWLVDVANFAMIEFMYPRHKDAHFEGTDSDKSPGRVFNNGEQNANGNIDDCVLKLRVKYLQIGD